MNAVISDIRSRAGFAVRTLLLTALAVCFVCFFSGCSNDGGPKLSYHTGNPEQTVSMEATLQEDAGSADQVYLCKDLNPELFSEEGIMYLKVDTNARSKVTVECDEIKVEAKDGFYPIKVEKNGQVVVTHEDNFLFLWKTTSTYSFHFRSQRIARLTDVSYRLDNGFDLKDVMMFDFDPSVEHHTVEKKIPNDTLELVLNCVPEDDNFEVTYSPSRRILIESEEGKELPVTVTVTVTDPGGEYLETTYTLDFTVAKTSYRSKQTTPKPSPTPTDSQEPVSSEAPDDTGNAEDEVISVPLETDAPVASATPVATEAPAFSVPEAPSAPSAPAVSEN